jgi:lipoate-protein ligase A
VLPPAEAVARPVGLLRAMGPDGPPALSWSAVRASALVLGRAAGEPDADLRAAREDGVVVLRRSSGGGPVLWDPDLLALDAVLPRGHPLAGEDVVASYRWLGEALADGLRRLGLEEVEVVSVEGARRARAQRAEAADACFGALSPYEVTAAGRKVAGLSQSRRRPGTLLQAGIPLRLDARRLARLMGRRDRFARALAAASAGLRELTPDVGPLAIVEAVDGAIRDALGVRLRDDVPTDAERAAIASARDEVARLGRRTA